MSTQPTQPEALRLADWLQAAVQIYPQRSEDDPGGYASEVDQVMDEAAAELRRLHALTQGTPATGGEPVAWRYQGGGGHYRYRGYVPRFDKDYPILKPIPLYTSPQPVREPLTDEEIADFVGDEYHHMTESELRWFRLGEAAHGIAGGQI